MTTNEPRRDQPGYRGALPTRNDRLARRWIIIVFAIFVAVILLSLFEVPSRFEPEPTPLPIPSIPVTPSPSPTESPSPSPSGSPEGSPTASPTPAP
jgi:hypothetical protein